MIPSHNAELLKIQFETEIEAPPDRVWSVLASPEGMHEWFSKHLVFEPRLGGRFQMEVSEPGGGQFTFTGEVKRFDPGRELAFTWIEHEHGKDPWPVATLVTFRLTPTARGTTLVTLIHTGFEALQGDLARREYDGHILGWERSETLKDLKAAVESAR
jgi:uncharacterized protein YndB with AHSA1/START domain